MVCRSCVVHVLSKLRPCETKKISTILLETETEHGRKLSKYCNRNSSVKPSPETIQNNPKVLENKIAKINTKNTIKLAIIIVYFGYLVQDLDQFYLKVTPIQSSRVFIYYISLFVLCLMFWKLILCCKQNLNVVGGVVLIVLVNSQRGNIIWALKKIKLG